MLSICSKKIPKIIIALDYSDINKALQLVLQLDPKIYRLKIGKKMFLYFGKKWIVQLHNLGFDVFLDLKFHDIPNTVFGAVKAAADLGVWMISVHTCGGSKMLQAAKKALQDFKQHPPLLIGITILTSFTKNDLQEIGINHSMTDHILLLSHLAKKCGLNGVVCSGKQANHVKNLLGVNFQVITPAIRLINDLSNDQNQTITPQLIKKYKIDYIVVGRSITESKNPIKKLKNIVSCL